MLFTIRSTTDLGGMLKDTFGDSCKITNENSNPTYLIGNVCVVDNKQRDVVSIAIANKGGMQIVQEFKHHDYKASQTALMWSVVDAVQKNGSEPTLRAA